MDAGKDSSSGIEQLGLCPPSHAPLPALPEHLQSCACVSPSPHSYRTAPDFTSRPRALAGGFFLPLLDI